MNLEIKNIKKRFGKKIVLDSVSVSAEKGTCVGILGVNGSGKSTFFNVLAGISSVDAGTFVYDGIDMFLNKGARSKKLGYITQNPPLIDELTALDNLKLWYNKADMKSELCGGVLEMLGVDKFLNVRVSKMSGGMKKRLAIGCAVAHKPEILLLDEPTAALDLVCKESITRYLNSFKSGGGIILIATHDVQDLPLCDKMYIFKNGFSAEYMYDGSIENLVGNLQ